MNLRAYFYSKRNRNLATLAGVAVISLVLAFLALHRRQAMMSPQYTRQLVFPGLAHAINAGEITHIKITSKKSGSFEVAFVPTKGWVLPDRMNYPASFEEVKKTLVALATMETIEPKTDNPELFHYVDLDAPPAGNGVAITLTGDKGHVMAALIAGKSEAVGDEANIDLFVRKANENQSWLVKSPVEIKSSQSDWMDKKVLDVDRDRVARVEVQPATGPSYTVSRTKPTEASFTVSPLPKGRELAYPGAGDGEASVMDDFTFDDSRPASDFDFNNAARVTTRTFDGLIVTVDVIKQGDDYWTRVFADSQPGDQKAAREALAINTHAAGWAFKLPAYKGDSFAQPLESLLKPKK
jgi:Domain of unknown function (DUF4340)